MSKKTRVGLGGRKASPDKKEKNALPACLLVDSENLSQDVTDLSLALGYSGPASFVQELIVGDPVGWQISALDRAKTVTHRLQKVLSLIGGKMKPQVYENFQAIAEKLYLCGHFEKWFKHKTTTLFSLATDQDLQPPLKDVDQKVHIHRVPGMFLSGGGYVFLRNLVGRRDLQKAWTINNLKKIVPCVDYAFIARSYQDHAAEVTKTESPFGVMEEGLLKSTIEKRIAQVCKIVREGLKEIEFRIPSVSAHVEPQATRQDGGAFGWFHNFVEPRDLHVTDDDCVWEDDWEEECIMNTGPDSYFEFFGRGDSAPDLGLNHCRVIALPEPCKARVITCGPSSNYHSARLLQKPWHTIMRKLGVFRLIGRPCSEDDISDIRWNADPILDQYLSGDYSSATDLLDPYWTRTVVESIFQDPDDGRLSDLTCFASNALLNHILHYPQRTEAGDKKKGKKDLGGIAALLNLGTQKQSWGQLMGSPLSFLVLCIVNAAATQASYDMYFREIGRFDAVTAPGFEVPGDMRWVDDERWERNLSSSRWIHRPHFLVNGDDVCGISSHGHYLHWQKAVHMASFKFSVGKNFLSPNFVTVNTEMYIPHETETQMGVQHEFVPYINGALLFPEWSHLRIRQKLDVIEGTSRCMSLGDMSFDLTRGFSLDKADSLMGTFMSEWQEYINLLPGFIPLFVPRDDGGLGLRQTRQRTLSVQQKKWVKWHRRALARESYDVWDSMFFRDSFNGECSIWDTVRTTHAFSVRPIGTRNSLILHRDDAPPPTNEPSFLGYLFGQYSEGNSVSGQKELVETMEREYQRAQGAINRSHVTGLQAGNWSNHQSFKRFSYYTCEVSMETSTSVESVFGAIRSPAGQVGDALRDPDLD
jgi:hypothetical protein